MQRIQKKNKKRVNVMILGVGTDLVEIDRMKKACEKEHFVSRTFTEAESRQAGGSASKLAGSGFRTFMPGDIEVLRDELGKPYVRLYGGALEQFEKMGMEQIHVSISNTNGLAMAFAVGEGRGEQKK